MFTGIVEGVGHIEDIQQDGDTRLKIGWDCADKNMALGASVCCSGVCLTVIDRGAGWFAVQASAETLSCTTLGSWRVGTKINLERALKVGDELGGHFVFGHVDACADIVSVTPEGESLRFVFEAPSDLSRFFAPKGSVALNGVSLTVNEVADNRFGVNMIPHTLAMTTFGAARQGERVNLEIDMLARYVARLQEAQ
ncbi:MAG: riboflavin synthase [Hyphomicrobiales bacterium]|nr:riboflavin synthase [Hyphomicrobiales bacterium]